MKNTLGLTLIAAGALWLSGCASSKALDMYRYGDRAAGFALLDAHEDEWLSESQGQLQETFGTIRFDDGVRLLAMRMDRPGAPATFVKLAHYSHPDELDASPEDPIPEDPISGWALEVWSFDLEGQFVGYQLINDLKIRYKPAPVLAADDGRLLVIDVGREKGETRAYGWDGKSVARMPLAD